MDYGAAKKHTMKNLLLVILLTVVSTSAVAYGKVFFSPDKRAALEKQRFQEVVLDSSVQPTQLEIITVDGFVYRSNGRSTVWINGAPEFGRKNKIRRDLSSVTISNSVVPVGDSVNVITKDTVHIIGSGSIKINDK
jgi:hypothetical protein